MKNQLNKFKKIINKNLKFIIPATLLIAAGGYFLWKQTSASQTELVFEQPQQRDLIQILELSGIVDAKTKARLRFLAGGKITYLGAQEGDWVKKWQTIATIDQRSLEKQLDKTLNNYMIERWDWNQTLDDTEDRWLPKSEERQVDQEQWQLENKVLDVEIQSLAIDNTVMSAPFAGILVQSPVSTSGVQVLSTDYFELVNPESLVFKAEVDEEDVAKLALGQTATISLDAYPDQTLETQLSYISYQSAQSSGGTVFLVELPIQEADLAKYRLGMNGDVAIELNKKESALSIPLVATRERGDKFYVDVKAPEGSPDPTIEKEIEVGLETERYVEVLSGLKPTDQVVIPQSD